MNATLHGVTRVRAVQAVWLIVAIAGTVLWFAAPASQWNQLLTACHPVSTCQQYQLDVASAHSLASHGISMSAYALYSIVVLTLVWVLWYGLAALIMWRKPAERGAVLSAFFLILFPLLEVGLWLPALALLAGIAIAALFVFGLLFPDGRFAPRWTRWLLVPYASSFGLTVVLGSSAIWLVPVVLAPIAVVAVQIHRFRSHSTWSQRQQTKWAFAGLISGILGLMALIALGLSQTQNNYGTFYQAFSLTGFIGVASTIPICIGIAVLRSRLWDIDRVINRALVYGSLTVSIAAIYIGSVIGLQALFRAVTGQQSEFAVAISTLVIAALFNPLRRRIQDFIARTFSRQKYNAQQVLAAFGATCRDETSLERLQANMVRVVEETMQPAHVSLWLREGARKA